MINITERKIIIPRNHRDNETILLNYIEVGNEDEREMAFYYLEDDEKYLEVCWNVFLSDTHNRVKHAALFKYLTINPKKIWDVLDYLIKTNHKMRNAGRPVSSHYFTNEFIVQVAKQLNRLHEKGTLRC